MRSDSPNLFCLKKFYRTAIKDNTRWKLEKVDVTSKYIYTVSSITMNGVASTTAYISKGEEKARVNGFFISDVDLTKSDFTAITGYDAEITVNADKTISVAYTLTKEKLQSVVNKAKDLLNKRGVGYPLEKSAAYVALNTIVESAEEAIKGESTTEYDHAYQLLQTQMTTYRATTASDQIQMPEDGKVYRIYALWADGTKVYAVNAGKTTADSKYYTSGSKTEPTDNTGLWVVQKVGNYYNIASAEANHLFTYVQGAGGAGKDKTPYTNIYSYAGATIGQIKIGEGSRDRHIVMNVDGSKMDHYTNTNTYNVGEWSTEWVFEEVTDFAGQPVKFVANNDGQNYATLNLPYASKLPEGVTAYKGNVSGNEVTLTEYKQAGEVLPANTPVLLTATSASFYNFAPAAYQAAEETGFQGTLAATAVTANNAYILAKKGEEVKFYLLNSERNTVNANKAYIVVSEGKAQAISFNFGTTTGIQAATTDAATAAPVFDLTGRRVVKVVKGGLYIQNGKKFIVK